MSNYNILVPIVMASLPFIAIQVLYNTIDKRAKKVIELLPADFLAKFEDVKIWFKGYDMTKRSSRYNIDIYRSLFVYNRADIYVYRDGLVVVGKKTSFKKTIFLSPFAICYGNGGSHLSMVPHQVSWTKTELIGADLDIQFQAPEYTNLIKLAVKHVGKELNYVLQPAG